MKQNHIIVFLFGIIFYQKITIVGHIYIGEIIALFYFIFQFFNLRFNSFEKKLIFFSFFGAIVQSLSNLYNQTDLDKSLKGFFAYMVFMSTIIFLCRYFKKSNNFNKAMFFFIGIIAGHYVSYLHVDIPAYSYANPWKWGLGNAVISLVSLSALYFNYKKDYPIVFYIIFTIAVIYISLLNNARSFLLVYGFALISYILFYKYQILNLKFFTKKSSFMLLPLIYFFLTIILGVVFAKNPGGLYAGGFQSFQEKNTREGQGEFGVVVSSRSDIVASYYAIKDKPIFGHGSYPVDKKLNYYMKELEFLHKFGYIQNVPNPAHLGFASGNYIPGHSFIFNAMVTGGILGSLFWLFITYFIVKNYANYAKFFPFFFHFWIINYFYTLFFSPWAAPTRMMLAINISLIITYIELVESNKSKQQYEKIN